MKRWLVSGGVGFIGHHLVRSLVARGHAGADRPNELCEHVTDRLPFVGRLVRDQLGQASLEVALDLAHELRSLVGELDDGDRASRLAPPR